MKGLAITLEFGAHAPPLSEQLRGEVSPDDARMLTDIHEAIIRLHIPGYISTAAARKAEQRLLRRCAERMTAYWGRRRAT